MTKNYNQNRSLFLSGRESNYPRNQLIITSLQKIFNTEVLSSQRHDISRGSYMRIISQSVKCIVKTILKLWCNNYRFIFIGFFGQLIVLPISLVTKTPLVFDFFISTYDTLVLDRKVLRPSSIIAKALFKLDYYSCKKSNLILVDTQSHCDYFSNTFFIPKDKMAVLHVGCDEEVFHPLEVVENPNLVLYYSTFMPLHGVEVVIQAAKILENICKIQFKLIGEGMGLNIALDMVEKLNVRNIFFSPPISLLQLPKEIAEASICLGGHFGYTEKAKRVIAGKTYQILAMKKPVIVSDCEANRELLTHKKDAWFCNLGDPKSLADGIKILHENIELRMSIAEEGYNTYKSKVSFEKLGREFEKILITHQLH